MPSYVTRAGLASSIGFVILALTPLSTYAATLTLPSRGPYTVGQTFSIPVYVSTRSGESMNAVSGNISYPVDKLQALSVTKGSIVNFWTQEPSISQGTVVFEGGVYNPGFSGTNGSLLIITFKVLGSGAAPLKFSSATVLANDGQGTNILDSATGVTLTLAAGTAPVAPTPTPTALPTASPVPSTSGTGLIIHSSTHSDSSKWYREHAASLSWKNPDGTTAVRIGYDKSSSGLPSLVYDAPPISHKDLTLDDGVWYFHAQARTGSGWGPVATYAIHIDSQPPVAMRITFPHGATTTDPRPIALFNTTDDLSGISYYEVESNGTGLVKVSIADVESNPYALPNQDPGMGRVRVTAYDAAGNATSAQAEYQVLGLTAPTLDPLPDLTVGDILQIGGITYPNARVDVYLVGENNTTSSQWVRTSPNGAFRVVWNKRLPAGAYHLYAQTTDEKGAKSDRTEQVAFIIHPQPLLSLGWLTLNAVSLVLVTITFIAGLGLLLWYLWHRFHGLRRHILHRADPIHRALHREFEELKDGIAAEIGGLETVRTKRQLTHEEDLILERLSVLVDRSEQVIEREMESLVSGKRRGRPSTGSVG